MRNKKDLFVASLLGGAIGDALGYTVEFMSLDEIQYKFGSKGITDLEVSKSTGKAYISDDTQMTLFTLDGMIWAYLRCSERGIGSYAGSGIYQSYFRWYYTQTNRMPKGKGNLWIDLQPHESDGNSILDYKELFSRRAPGITCLSAIESGIMGTIEDPINDCKGCGGVMRVAPVGLFLHKQPEFAFRIGAEVAAITHGHPTGYLSSGAFATIIAELINEKSIMDSTMSAIDVLKTYKHHKETLSALEKAVALAKGNENHEEAIRKIGEGWIAEEALAIALYCALKNFDAKEAFIMSVNHDGDSDSTGAICGNILGAAYGTSALPKEWIDNVELKDLLINMAAKLYDLSHYAFNSR